MLKKITNNIGLMICLLIIVLTGIFIVTLFSSERRIQRENSVIDTAYLLPVAEKITKLDSLPHYLYKKIEDSLSKLSEIEKEKNTLHPWGILAGISINSRFAGFVPAFRTWYEWYGDNRSHFEKSYYFTLTGYTLEPESAFFWKDGKAYLMKPSGNTREIHAGYLPESGTALIPVSKQTYQIGFISMLFILVVIFLALLYILIALPINVLLNISRGKVFTKRNIRDLHIIAYTLFVCFLSSLIIPYLLHIIFAKYLPDEFTISFRDLWVPAWSNGLIGIIAFAIAKAFAKGYRLQQEQDLTI